MKSKSYLILVVLVVGLLLPLHALAELTNCTYSYGYPEKCMDTVSYSYPGDWRYAPVQTIFYYDKTPYIRTWVDAAAPSSDGWNYNATTEWTDPLGNTYQGKFFTSGPTGEHVLYSLPNWSDVKMPGTWTITGSYVATYYNDTKDRWITYSGTFNPTSFTVLTESTPLPPPPPPDPCEGYDVCPGDFTIKDKLGVGTTNPGARLHVRQSDSGYTPDNVAGIFVENKGSVNDYFVFQTATKGGGKSFSITNAGNVGIGTTTPQSKLAVAGLPTTPPDSSGIRGGLCVTNNGNIWVDTTLPYDCK